MNSEEVLAQDLILADYWLNIDYFENRREITFAYQITH
jgi:hypothetical protein